MKLKDKLEKLGFYNWHTGGGCQALRKDFEDGTFFMVTDDDGIGFENLESKVMVGFYDAEDPEKRLKDSGNDVDDGSGIFVTMSANLNNH